MNLRRLLRRRALRAQLTRAPLALETGAAVAARRHLETIQAAYHTSATQARGLWSESPATIATLKDFIGLRADKRQAALARAWDWAHFGVAVAVCAPVYGLLWTLRWPITPPADRNGIPSPAQLRTTIRERGTAGRVYGYTVVGWTHLLGYGVAWLAQLPGRLYLTLALTWALTLTLLP